MHAETATIPFAFNKSAIEAEIKNYLAGDDGFEILDADELTNAGDFYTPLSIYSLIPIGDADPVPAVGPEARRLAIIMIRNLESTRVKPRMAAYSRCDVGPEAACVAFSVRGFTVSMGCIPEDSDDGIRQLRFTASVGVAEEDSTSL